MTIHLGSPGFKDLTFGGFYSGGVDSKCCALRLREAGVKRLISYTADLGQPDERSLEDVRQGMLAAGADEAYVFDAKPLYARFMLQALQGDARYGEDYFSTTGVGRAAMVATVLPHMLKHGVNVATHGATGKGNDQFRIELMIAALTGKILVYAPHRDPIFKREFPGRQEMIAYIEKHQGVSLRATRKEPYSTDANYGGLTHEAGQLEFLTTPTTLVKPIMMVLPMEAPDMVEEVTINIQRGVPRSINGKRMNLVDIFLNANIIAGRNGIGLTDQVEDRYIGGKSRGVYEAPGVWLLHHAFRKLRQIILERERHFFFRHMSLEFGRTLYNGDWFKGLAKDLLAYLTSVAKDLSGTVTFGLYKGNVFFIKVTTGKKCMYCPELLSMEGVGDFKEADSQGMMNIMRLIVDLQREKGLTRTKY
jgi:argininosuccinate synthase